MRSERELWQAVWKQMEAFLDRIDAAAGEDEGYVSTMCALFPVFGVIERARKRSLGYRLADALPAAPRGAGVALTLDLDSRERIPGVEDCEFAVSNIGINGDGEIDDDPVAVLWRTTTISTFRDEKHGADVALRAPAYEFGPLSTTAVPGFGSAARLVPGVIDGGFFPRDAREGATSGDSPPGDADTWFTSWEAVRSARLVAAALKASPPGPDSGPLASQLGSAPTAAQLVALAGSARSRAAACRSDKAVLDGAVPALDQAGAADASAAVSAASAALAAQAGAYELAAARMGDGVLTFQERVEVLTLLAQGDGSPSASGLPAALAQLDRDATAAMNEAVENRIGYPDGPLRQLRLLELTLRFFWDQRRTWMRWRHRVVLSVLHRAYMGVFTASLGQVLAGKASGLPVPAGTTVGKDCLTGATEIGIAPPSGAGATIDTSEVRAGQIAVIGGDRPACAPVVAVLFDGKKTPPQRFKVPAMPVSVAADPPGLPGVAGMIQKGAPLGAFLPRLFTADEILRGRSSSGANRDALVQNLIAHRSRLALVLGESGGADRPAPPAMARPYAGIARFALEGTIEPTATRLFLSAVPAASASGNGEALGVARPGEVMLLRGRDADGAWWQTALEVEKSELVPASQARADEETGATAVPACFCGDDPIMVVYLRSMVIPSALEGAVLHRDFAGFGARSLMTGVMLPVDLDGQTASASENGQTVRRDPELRAAVKLFDDWLPRETQ
jgi:hypothetical protein